MVTCHLTLLPRRLELALADAAWLDMWFGVNTPGIEDLAWFPDASGACSVWRCLKGDSNLMLPAAHLQIYQCLHRDPCNTYALVCSWQTAMPMTSLMVDKGSAQLTLSCQPASRHE